jgi:hypothetical protein
MKQKADPALLTDLVARLERANAEAREAPRVEAPSLLAPTPADRNERRSPRAAAARLEEPRTNSHAAAYLGVGAVVLGLFCLIILAQLTF